MSILLQAAASAATNASEAANGLSVWQLCVDAGVIMIPMVLLLLISVYVFTERTLVLRP